MFLFLIGRNFFQNIYASLLILNSVLKNDQIYLLFVVMKQSLLYLLLLREWSAYICLAGPNCSEWNDTDCMYNILNNIVIVLT